MPVANVTAEPSPEAAKTHRFDAARLGEHRDPWRNSGSATAETADPTSTRTYPPTVAPVLHRRIMPKQAIHVTARKYFVLNDL